MARTGSETTPTPPDHQQMDRSNDPETTRAMDAVAPEVALSSRRQRLAGSAVGVGSIGYDESGAFDVGAGESVAAGREPPETTDAPKVHARDPAKGLSAPQPPASAPAGKP